MEKAKNLIKSLLRCMNIRKCLIGNNCRISWKAKCKESVFEDYCAVNGRAEISNCYFGKATYIAGDNSINNITVGKFCSIGPRLRLAYGRHPTRRWVSTHPAFFSNEEKVGICFVKESKFDEIQFVDEAHKFKVMIGNDVWIGADVTIFDGVRIGDGAIIAAGAVVTKDVQPYSIVGGVPAKRIRYRFEREDIDWLQNIKWWDKDISWIQKYAPYFESIDELKSRLAKDKNTST